MFPLSTKVDGHKPEEYNRILCNQSLVYWLLEELILIRLDIKPKEARSVDLTLPLRVVLGPAENEDKWRSDAINTNAKAKECCVIFKRQFVIV